VYSVEGSTSVYIIVEKWPRRCGSKNLALHKYVVVEMWPLYVVVGIWP
jgi:hypothetical protein